jgi:hypothetical protein
MDRRPRDRRLPIGRSEEQPSTRGEQPGGAGIGRYDCGGARAQSAVYHRGIAAPGFSAVSHDRPGPTIKDEAGQSAALARAGGLLETL